MTTKKLADLHTVEAICPTSGKRYVVRYGFDGAFAIRHKQRPYLSVTCSIYERRPTIVAGTETWRDVGGGILSAEDAARVFPGHPVNGLIPFHLCSAPTAEPTHYVANVVFLAGDRDHNGLREGERRQLRNGRTGLLCWRLGVDNGTEDGGPIPGFHNGGAFDGDEPPAAPVLKWFPWWIVGKGKARELDAARRVAVWPDATDAELCAEPEELKRALLARLPALQAKMQAACLAAGVGWPNERGELD